MQRRAYIQSQAFMLFQEQGYHDTTINQIAEAADISPATYFRYFPTKEAVVLFDALDFVMQENAEPPESLSPIEAMQWVYNNALGKLTTEQAEEQRLRFELIRSVPELRARLADEMITHTEQLTKFISKRMGAGFDPVRSRALAGAVVGAMLAGMLHDNSQDSYASLVSVYLGQLAHLFNDKK